MALRWQDNLLRDLLGALKRLEIPQGRIARRNALAAVRKALRAVERDVTADYPPIAKPRPPRLDRPSPDLWTQRARRRARAKKIKRAKIKVDRRLYDLIHNKGYAVVYSGAIPPAWLEAKVPIKQVGGTVLVPAWAPACGHNVKRLRECRRSWSTARAVVTQAALSPGAK